MGQSTRCLRLGDGGHRSCACMKNIADRSLELSVVVPTFGRPDAVQKLLESLRAQTLESTRFEVVIVDDGSPTPIQLEASSYPFRVVLLRQDNQGPGAARNLAFEHCQAALVLILNDDAVPASKLLETHLAAHADAPPKTAVLGSFHFTEEALRSPFVQLLDDSNLLFAFRTLRHGELSNWTCFWTCNISLPLAAIQEVGGFDAETFPEAICEDVELGYRLEREGWSVLYRSDAECHHDHELTSAAYLKRGESLGRNQWRMARKHPGIQVLGRHLSECQESILQSAHVSYEAYHDIAVRFAEQMRLIELEYHGKSLPVQIEAQMNAILPHAHMCRMLKGIIGEVEGHDPDPIMRDGAPTGVLTSIVIVSHGALERTRKCLEAIRLCADECFPMEIIVVDNGSTDGSAEFLAAQVDVQLVRNEENLGAPVARNQALALVQGAWICFMDNDAIASPGWLERMHFHGSVDSKVGCVCPVSDRAAHGQQIPYGGGDDLESVHAFARQRSRTEHRKTTYKMLFPSFCVLVKREVIDTIGGFDPIFTPWGFEDDDFALRAFLAGFRARMARDVFIRHESYGGAKSLEHRELLLANWQRFAQKWIPGPVPPYGELCALGELSEASWTTEELYVPIEVSGRAGAYAGANTDAGGGG